MPSVEGSNSDASHSSSDDEERKPVSKKPTGIVQHHEIGEMAHFLGAFGKTKEEAVKTLLASSLQIVGLEEVKKKYEGEWAAIQNRVGKAIEAFFTKKLRKIDTFVQLQEGRFALIFANMSREEGQAKATQLSRELINLLFGEMPGAELISVEVMVLDIDLTDSIDDFGSIEEIIEHFQVAIKDAEEKEEEQLKEVEPVLSVVFRPAVNHRKKIISVSEVVPCRKSERETTLLQSDDPMYAGSPHLRSELDLLILKEAGEVLKKLGATGNKPIIMISVSFETLANAYVRRTYADYMKELPEYSRKHLILNVEGICSGTPNSRYRQILTILTPLILGFSFEVESEWDDFHAISDLPVLAVGVSSNNEEDLPWIERFFKRAHQEKKKCIWRNLQSDDLARQAFRIRANYVSGPVIGSVQEIPTRPFSIK